MLHLLLNLGNGLTRIQAFGAHSRAVHNSVAAVQLILVIQFNQALLCKIITTINNPAVGIQQHRWTQVFVRGPPVGWA